MSAPRAMANGLLTPGGPGAPEAGPLVGGGRPEGGSPSLRRGPRPRPGAFALGPFAFALAIVGIAVYVVEFVLHLSSTDYNVLGLLFVLPGLLIIGCALLRLAIRSQPDPWIRRVIVVAFLIKIAAAFANYFVQFVVYGGAADAVGYSGFGSQLYTEWRHGHFDLKPIAQAGGDSSLTFARIATGVVYYFVGPSQLAGFLVFSFVAFWGLYFFLRAFQTAFPNGAHRRYGVLVLLFPSLVFWTSGIGKEAWMVLTLGLFTWGAARIFTHRRGGFVLLALGLGGTSLARPHVSLIALLAVTAGYFIRRRPSMRSPLSAVTKVFGLGALLLLGALAAYKFQSQFGVHGINSGSLNAVLKKASKGSDTGQATFNGSITPFSVAALLFRPFPWEATSLTSLISVAEGMTLLATVVISRRRLVSAFRLAFKDAAVMFCGAYVAIFGVAFSTLSNFGTLARERTQVLPFVFVLISLPLAAKRRRSWSKGGRRRSVASVTRHQEPLGTPVPADVTRRAFDARSVPLGLEGTA